MSHASQQPVTKETLRKLQLLPEHAEKLSMQDSTSPLGYSNVNTGLLSNLVESRYANHHKIKVNSLDQRVDMFVKSHERVLPHQILAREKRIQDPARVGRSDSKGLLVLTEGDDRRK